MNARTRLQRRTFLKAVSLGLSAPLAWRMSKMAIAAPTAAPTRFLVLYIPHGLPVEHHNPTSTGTLDFESASGVKVFSPLTPYQKLANLYRGIEYVGENNHPAIGSVMTNRNGASVEHVIANKLGVPAVHLGAIPWRVNDFGPDSQIYHDGTDWIRAELNPVKAADTLLKAKDNPDDGPSEADFRRLALSLTIEEVDALRKEIRSLTREQSKLDIHLEGLQALQSSNDDPGNQMSCESTPMLPAVEAVRAASSNGSNSGYFLDEANFSKIYEAQLEVAAHALLCGSAQVIGFQTMYANATVNFGFMGVSQDHHDPLSHSIDAAGRESFAKAQQWLLSRFADICLTQLAKPDPTDPGKTVLDNTLIYIASEIADGNAHNCRKETMWVGGKEVQTYVPLLTLGGASGRMKTGQILDFDNRSHADMLMTLCSGMGTPVGDFGPNSGSSIAEALA